MLDLIAAGAGEVIRWEDLGLRNGIDLGFFTLRFYSLAYLAGIFLGYWHLSRMIKGPGSPMAQRHADDLFFYCTLGIIIGGRLGYATFYQPELWTSTDLFKLWEGGMSFHGGLIGTSLAIIFVCWRNQLNLIRVADYVSVNVGFGMLFGRLANFVNGELWGRPAGPEVPWAMIFPSDPMGLPRHPSQLYEAGLEGALVILVMLALFWSTRARFRPGFLVGVFVTLISLGRFTAEFFRSPDVQLAEFAARSGLNMGQWLTIPLILAGIGMVIWSLMRPPLAGSVPPPATA